MLQYVYYPPDFELPVLQIKSTKLSAAAAAVVAAVKTQFNSVSPVLLTTQKSVESDDHIGQPDDRTSPSYHET